MARMCIATPRAAHVLSECRPCLILFADDGLLWLTDLKVAFHPHLFVQPRRARIAAHNAAPEDTTRQLVEPLLLHCLQVACGYLRRVGDHLKRNSLRFSGLFQVLSKAAHAYTLAPFQSAGALSIPVWGPASCA